ncbi:hypothetical protein [Psychroserpens damuponensis]|uniref:hypothetical protein n=1 Tax=Psychroserpens damuponensis TaxID=943936 RepID=UPI000AAFBDDB|nr:hypothetical protein [Psychroserpens damuponensis]
MQLTVAQTDNLKWLDLQLSNYKYPFPVSTLELNIQNQTLNMAYINVKARHHNRLIQ